MPIRDTRAGYGSVSRFFHWGMAVAIFGLFGLGLWMVGLDYYSPYYKSAPDLHRSIGMVLLAALVLRGAWRLMNEKPADDGLSPFERKAARFVHAAFYPLLLVLMVSGYLISTLDGRGIDVFGHFTVPSVLEQKGFEDIAGLVHEISAYMTMGLAALHSAAAVKHHVKDRSDVLSRMWSGPPAS